MPGSWPSLKRTLRLSLTSRYVSQFGVSVRLAVQSIFAAADYIASRRFASEGKRRKGPCKRRGREEGQRKVLHVYSRGWIINDRMMNELTESL